MLAWWRRLAARLQALTRSSDLDRDFAQELESHLEMLTADNIRRGIAPAEARRQAAVRLGGISSLRSRHREERGFRVVDNLLQDLRFAGRLMARDRWFSAAAIAAIALGIGANTVGFTIVNAAFFRGFGLHESDRLLAISWRPETGRRMRASVIDLHDLQTQARSFTGIAGYAFGAMNISDDHAAPEQTQGAWVTANHFDVLRLRPILGRSFLPGEDRPGAEPAVIIGYEIWTNRFARDPQIIGRVLRVNGRPATIVGVLAELMKFPDNAELWVTFIPTDAQLARDVRVLSLVGRLADGVSARQAAVEVESIARRAITAHPDATRGLIGGQVEAFGDRYLGDQASAMFVTVMGAVVFVLLIACANVANLLLSRAVSRGREVALRYSLGATRLRIVRQLLIESIALAGLGGLAGLILAIYGISAFDAAVQTSQPPYWLRFTVDYRVLMYVAGICVLTGVMFGLAPALHVARESQHDALKEGGRATLGNRRTSRFRTTLLVGELALTLVLLCGAGLMLRSFVALYASEPGFDVDGLLRMRMQLPASKYGTVDARRQFFEQLQPRLAAIPGVQGAAITTSVPPLDDEEQRFEIDRRTYADHEGRPFVATVTVSSSYFDVLGVPMKRGRSLRDLDGSAGVESAVISDAFATRYFAGEDPIGRRIRFVARDQGGTGPAGPWRTIVGVAAPFLQGSSDEAFRSPVVYLPLPKSAPGTVSIVIRSGLPPATIMHSVRSVVQTIDIDQPVFTVETITDVIAFERLLYRIFATLFAVLAFIGLLLSAVGVYGVMAYAVTQRTHEIGIRMAVGARRGDVLWLFLRRGIMQIAFGLLLGLPAALALARLARFRLVEIEPGDPVTMMAITFVLVTVAVAACVLPVRKATQVNPVVALRAD
jgi:predicted permease